MASKLKVVELNDRYKTWKEIKNIRNNNWAGVRLKSNGLCCLYSKFPLLLVCDTNKTKRKEIVIMIIIVDILESMIVYTETVTLKRNNSKTNQNV